MSLKVLAETIEKHNYEIGILLDDTLLRFSIDKVEKSELCDGMTLGLVLYIGHNKIFVGADAIMKSINSIPNLSTKKLIAGYKVCNSDSKDVFFIFREY